MRLVFALGLLPLLAGTAIGSEPAPVVVEPEATVVAASLRFWFDVDYLLWKVNSHHVPVLAGSLPASLAERIQVLPPGAIRPIFGGPASDIDFGWQPGIRLAGGVWLGDERVWCLDAGFFALSEGSQRFVAASADGDPALGPVFFDPAAGRSVLVMSAVPGLRNGSVTIDATNRLWSAEINARHRWAGPGVLENIDLLVGFRHLNFEEDLSILSASTAIPNGRLPCG